MKLSVDNFDDKALKRIPQEPYITLHLLRDNINAQVEARKTKEGQEKEPESAAAEREKVFYDILKKLVDWPLYDVAQISLLSVKDLFNAIGERLSRWRTLETGFQDSALEIDPQTQRNEQILVLLQAGATLSSVTSPLDKVDNSTCLSEILKESQDPRIIVAAARLLHNVAGGLLWKTTDNADRITYLAGGQNLLRSQENHFTLQEICSGVNMKGERLDKCDFIVEIEKPAVGLNDRSQLQVITIPREQALTSEISSVITDIIRENSQLDDAKTKVKLEAKIMWFRLFKGPSSFLPASLLALSAIRVASYYKQDARHVEFAAFIKEPFAEQAIELLKNSSSIEHMTKLIHTLAIVQKQRGETTTVDPFLRLPEGSSDSEEQPILCKILQDLSSIKLEDQSKIVDAKLIDSDIVKSSYFQLWFLRFTKQILQLGHNRQHLSPSLLQSIISSLLRFMDETPLNCVYTYHSMVTAEALSCLRGIAKARFEEQNNIIKRFENRLIYEVDNIEIPHTTSPDGEDLLQQQEQTDRQSVIKIILTILNDLVQRDRENIGIARRIQETQILPLLLKITTYNIPEKGHLIDGFFPMYFALIGQICSDNPAVTPVLIKNGVIPSLINSVNSRIPETSESLYLFMFALTQMTLHEEGKKLADDAGVFKSVINQVVFNEKFQSLPNTNNVHVRTYTFNLFDRNPAYKVIAADAIGELIARADEICQTYSAVYYDFLVNLSLTLQEKNDELTKLIKKDKDYKALLSIVNMILNFTGTDERGHDRNLNQRHVLEIFSAPLFEKLLKFHETMAKNPALSDISLLLAKGMKPLLEIGGFPGNVTKFIECFSVCNQAFMSVLTPNQLFNIKQFDFTVKPVIIDEPMDEEHKEVVVEKSQHKDVLINHFNCLLVYVRTLQLMHSATLLQVIQNDKVKKLIKSVYYTLRVLLNMKIQHVMVKYTDLVSLTGNIPEDQSKQQQSLALTQKAFAAFPLEERMEHGTQINLSFVRTRDTMLKELIPMFSISIQCMNELMGKFCELSFTQRQRDRGEQRDNPLEGNLRFAGKLAYKMSKQLSKESLKDVKIDNSNESVESIFRIFNSIETLNKLSLKGFISGAAFFEFFKRGGLSNIIECFNWLGSHLKSLKEEELLRLQFMFIERICQNLSQFITKILEEERNPGRERQAEPFIHSIITLKMGTAFESPKHFYQNVCYTLLNQMFRLDEEPTVNPLEVLNRPGLTYLHDSAMAVLNCSSKQFQNCTMLKMAGQGSRHYEQRDDQRQRRNQPDPVHIQQLLDMGFGFSRERVIQALQQSRDNLNQATNLLLEWQMQGNMGIEDDGAADGYRDDLSSKQSDDEDMRMAAMLSLQEAIHFPIVQPKLFKVQEQGYLDTLKKAQQQGFKWLTEGAESVDLSRCQAFILETMRNEKSEQDMKNMYAKIDEIVKKNITSLNDFIKSLNKLSQDEDHKMSTEADEKQLNFHINAIVSSIRIVQRLIIHQKQYFKESISSDIPTIAHKNLSLYFDILVSKELGLLNDQKSSSSGNFQKLIFEFILLLMSCVQMSHLLIAQYQTQLQSPKHKIEDKSIDMVKKKIEKFRKKINAKSIFDLTMRLADLSGDGLIRSQVLLSGFSLALRIIIDKESLESEQRNQAIQTLFAKLTEVTSKNNSVRIDQKIISSIAILYFENDSVIQSQLEKFTQRVLFTKFEYEQSLKKNSEEGSALTKTSFSQFLQYFSSLSNKNQDLFKQILTENCEITSVRNQNQVNYGKASIQLKDPLFQDVKKQVAKERSSLKQFVKTIETSSDKELKQQIQKSKKALSQLIPEQRKADIEVFITQLMDSTQPQADEITAYLTATFNKESFIVGQEQANTKYVDNQSFSLEMLSKLCLAYPAYSVMLIPQKQPMMIQQKKQSFFSWYIKEFLVQQMLIKQIASKAPDKEGDPVRAEISFKVKTDIKPVDQFVFNFINKLTGYNHLMNLNEQLIKHQLRTKFMLEALHTLQRIAKDRNTANNNIRQRCLILSCLSVIDALVNSSSTQVNVISSDNYVNSLRVCFVRDAVHKDQNLPNGFLKIMDDLFTDFIDVALPSNGDIVGKCVNVLKLIADFIQTEKKKEEAKAEKEAAKEVKKAASVEEGKVESVLDAIMRDDNLLMDQIGIGNRELPQVQVQAIQSLQDQANIDDSEEDVDVEHPVQQPNEEDDADEEDEGDEGEDEDDEDDDDDDQDDEFDDDPIVDDHNEDIIDEIEDDYDVEVDYENEEQDWGYVHRQERRGGAQFDIINQNPRVEIQRNWRGLGDPAVRRPDRVDWTDEEAEVQRILGNLRGNHPDNVRADPMDNRIGLDRGLFAPPLHHMYGRDRPRAEVVQEDLNSKKGVIEQIFEDFKIISEKELFDMMILQRNSFDQDSKGSAPRAPISSLERIQNLLVEVNNPLGFPRGHPFGRVDEIDDIEFIEQLRNQGGLVNNPFLERLLRPEDMGINIHNDIMNAPIPFPNWMNPRDQRDYLMNQPPRFGQAFQNQPELQQYDQGTYNQQLRQHLNQYNSASNEILGQQLFQQMEVHAEEEKKDDPPPANPLNKGASSSLLQPAAANSSNEAILQAFFQASSLLPDMPVAAGSPQVVDNEIEDIRRRMEQQSRNLRNTINLQQESLQRMVSDQANINQQNLQPVVEVPPVIEPPAEVVEIVEQVQEPVQIQPEQVQNDVSVFEEMLVNEEVNPPVQIEEEEEDKQPEIQAEQQNEDGKTFGYDNEFLLANGIDPSILLELPEDMRAELLSSIDMPNQEQQLADQQQPPRQNEEEKKEEGAQPQPAGAQPAQNVPEYFAIAQALGLDPEFLENLPEDMRNELIQQAQQSQQPVRREAEQMDIASFIATVTDQSLRREIFMNMDEATLATLPPNLMAEARRVQEHIRMDRQRARDGLHDRARGLMDQMNAGHGAIDPDDPMTAIFGRRIREEQRQRDLQNIAGRRELNLEESINQQLKNIAEETPRDDIISSISQQLVQNERILESLLLILLTNDKIECDLIPCIQALIKIQSNSGVPIIRNKVVNAITFLLKALGSNDDETIKALFPNHTLKKKQSTLILLGSFRLLLKQNKSLMKFILKGLITKDEQAAKASQQHVLKKQMKALSLKSQQTGETTLVEEAHSSIESQHSSRNKLATSSLVEIFSLIKSEYFKQDKMLMRNLSLLIHQILKQFNTAKDELELSSSNISPETIQAITEVLSLDIIDQSLMDEIGDFLYQISLKKWENFQQISGQCGSKSSQLITALNTKLFEFSLVYEEMKLKISPSKSLGMDSRQLSSNSAFEEDKQGDVVMIDTTVPSDAHGSRSNAVKLSDDEEKHLRQALKVYEDSEVLLRLFKLFNLFFEKFSAEQEKAKKEEGVIDTLTPQSKEATEFVKSTYKNPSMEDFIVNVNTVLKIALRANIEMTEGVSNLIFCVFSSFYPELLESIKLDDKQAAEDKKLSEGKNESKFQIKMMPLAVGTEKIKEKFTLFKNTFYITDRIDQLSTFCLSNKRIINKMIKQKPALFVNELEGLIKYMPNLLDFDNKRTYFKKELAKLKKSNYQEQIQLFIRRDDIFMDAYAQINVRQAEEMKGRLHISFTGERGQDAGGLTRDFFIELSREMFNPNYSLFNIASSGSTYYPNPKSYVEADHLKYFKFIGRIIGKALFDECLLECYFVKSLYKIMTGEPLSFQDVEDFDNEFYTNLKWCLENDVACLMTTFSVEQDYFGKMEEIELIEGGKKIDLTNDNKRDYVERLAYFKLYKLIQKQIDAFLEGFYELIPKELVSIFNFKELELLISGLPNFDLEDLKANTEYSGYTPNSPQVLWLWEILEQLENSERAEFLQFVTGSSKVPLDGFKGLIGMRGPQKFSIAKIKSDDIMRLPSGHTCFNQIDIPEYPSKEIMHERLLIAIKETKGFGFA